MPGRMDNDDWAAQKAYAQQYEETPAQLDARRAAELTRAEALDRLAGEVAEARSGLSPEDRAALDLSDAAREAYAAAREAGRTPPAGVVSARDIQIKRLGPDGEEIEGEEWRSMGPGEIRGMESMHLPIQDVTLTAPGKAPGTALEKWADVAMWQAPKHDDPQKPQVFVTIAPEDPLGAMAMVNGMYTGKVYYSPSEVSDDERREAWDAATRSLLSQAPLEWFQISLLFENVTRAFTHQLVRQRMAGYAQESMRFAVKEDAHDAVKLPPSLSGTQSLKEFWRDMNNSGVDPELNASQEQRWRNRWDLAVSDLAVAYEYLVGDGMPAEDARGLLPTNILTRIHQHVDMGTLLKMAGTRLCTQAQFEWRAVMAQLVQALREYLPEDHPNRWQYELIAERFRPVCFAANKCTMKAKSDRWCAIRDQVDAFEARGIPSDRWEQERPASGPGMTVTPIRPPQWLADPTAARVKP